MLDDLLLSDAYLRQVFQELVHGWGGVAAWREIHKTEKKTKREDKKKLWSYGDCGLSVILQQYACILHQCGGLKNHTTGCCENRSPEGVFIEQ